MSGRDSCRFVQRDLLKALYQNYFVKIVLLFGLPFDEFFNKLLNFTSQSF